VTNDLQVMLLLEELTALDDVRCKLRMRTRAAAVRELLRLGLSVHRTSRGGAGTKSSSYGVFSRGPDGHAQGGAGSDPEAAG
jgi:hypothetical protein